MKAVYQILGALLWIFFYWPMLLAWFAVSNLGIFIWRFRWQDCWKLEWYHFGMICDESRGTAANMQRTLTYYAHPLDWWIERKSTYKKW